MRFAIRERTPLRTARSVTSASGRHLVPSVARENRAVILAEGVGARPARIAAPSRAVGPAGPPTGRPRQRWGRRLVLCLRHATAPASAGGPCPGANHRLPEGRNEGPLIPRPPRSTNGFKRLVARRD